MLSNYISEVKESVASRKEINIKERNELVELAKKRLNKGFEIYRWNANINGIVIQLQTNSFHLYDFWVENWYSAPRSHTVLPHGYIYAVTGIEGYKPSAYYNPDTKTAIFINTEYYGQCKSWALGIAADILEVQHNIHSIHGSCAVVKGKGVVIIAPTGTGKSTHIWGLLKLSTGKILADDWIFLQYKKGLAMADVSEKKFYLRTDMIKSFPDLRPLFERCKCENVVDNDFAAFANSRAILNPEWIAGPDKFVDRAVIKASILLRRDASSPPEQKLSSHEAIDILEKGRSQILSGEEGEKGIFKNIPYYNPHLMVKRTEIQQRFFEQLFDAAPCYIVNTGVETVEKTQDRIRKMLMEA